MKIVAFAGSVRHSSFNYGLLRAAKRLGSQGNLNIEVVDQSVIGALPLYSGDVDESGRVQSAPAWPESVAILRAKVREADGLLLACNEYNYMVSPILTNAIAWLSRGNAVDPQPMQGKPVAIVGAAGGMGSSRAQYQLRQSLVFLRAHAFPGEFFCNAFAGNIFAAENGDLVDQATEKKLSEHISAFQDYVAKLK